MRTNIVLDDELIEEAKHYSKARTKRALIEDALRTMVRVRTEESRRKSYKDRLLAVQNRFAALTFRESASEIIRQDREGR
jgi:Arc/MetJ family transcription regulator